MSAVMSLGEVMVVISGLGNFLARKTDGQSHRRCCAGTIKEGIAPPESPPIRGVDEVWEFEFHLFRVWVKAGKQLNRLVTCEHLSVSFWEAIDSDT